MLTRIIIDRRAVFALTTALLLSACGGGGGGGGGSAPNPLPTTTAPPATPTATPGPPGPSSVTINATQGGKNGTLNAFNPPEGNTSSGGSGSAVDGVTCDPTMSNNYHVHTFLGLYVNGTLTALPAGMGMVNPTSPVPADGFVNAASCFYHLHTHDSSGIVHIEDPSLTTPVTQSLYTLKTVLDIWGITTDANHFGPFSGPVRVFTSGQTYRGDANNGTVNADTLTFYGQDANNIPIYSHELIYIEVGPTYPASLPNVHFYTEF